MPVLQRWPGPGLYPVAGKDEGFFQTAVAICKKFNLAGFSLDVESGPPKEGTSSHQAMAEVEELAAFLATFTARMKAAGLAMGRRVIHAPLSIFQ